MCGNCGALTGPKGVEQLVVRQWVCSACGDRHDRDVNAARNILAGSRCGPPSRERVFHLRRFRRAGCLSAVARQGQKRRRWRHEHRSGCFRHATKHRFHRAYERRAHSIVLHAAWILKTIGTATGGRPRCVTVGTAMNTANRAPAPWYRLLWIRCSVATHTLPLFLVGQLRSS